MKKDMTYLVMEVHEAYAVLLDNQGCFLKAANKNYETGEVVTDVIPVKYPEDKERQRTKIIRMAAALAACIGLALFGTYEYQYIFTPYGTVQMQINPEVAMTMSRSGRVLALNGMNEDGEVLLEDYEYKGKDRYEVVDEID